MEFIEVVKRERDALLKKVEALNEVIEFYRGKGESQSSTKIKEESRGNMMVFSSTKAVADSINVLFSVDIRKNTNERNCVFARDIFYKACIRDGFTRIAIGKECGRDNSTVTTSARLFEDKKKKHMVLSKMCDMFESLYGKLN